MSIKRKNIPNAAILISSMRSIGYDFETAVSDIIDNSITANAKNINIFFPVGTGLKLYLQIFDDGDGMTENELFEAMRFGSIKNERGINDLGRFGLGLKTASISQCKRLIVISKKEDKMFGFCWDIDIILKEQTWEMQELSINEILKTPNIDKFINLDSFTVVHWENFDSISKDVTIFQDENDVFFRKISQTDKHLALVFHRFITDGLNIQINNRSIRKIDPFLQYHNKTAIKPEQMITTKTSNGLTEKIKIQMFVLPFHKDLSNEDYESLGGQDEIDSQGFYIYRNKRLMIHGTWFKIKPKAELSRNARIKIDIPNTLDDLWSIDIKKERAIIPGVLLEQLRKEVSDAVEKSKKIYEYKGTLETKKGSIWNKREDLRDKNVYYEINKESELIQELINTLDDKNIMKIQKLFTLIELSLPYRDIYNSVSDKKDVNKADDNQTDMILLEAFSLAQKTLKTQNLGVLSIVEKICSYEPFRSANIKESLLVKLNER